MLRAAWTAEKVASANAGDLDLANGDFDLALKRLSLDGELDLARARASSGDTSSSASLRTDSAMFRRALCRDSVSSRICLEISDSCKSAKFRSPTLSSRCSMALRRFETVLSRSSTCIFSFSLVMVSSFTLK